MEITNIEQTRMRQLKNLMKMCSQSESDSMFQCFDVWRWAFDCIWIMDQAFKRRSKLECCMVLVNYADMVNYVK